MTGWFEAGAITERARPLVRSLDFGWGEARGGCCFAMPVVAEGSVAGRGPPGTGVARRGGEAAELGVDGVQGGECSLRSAVPGAGAFAGGQAVSWPPRGLGPCRPAGGSPARRGCGFQAVRVVDSAQRGLEPPAARPLRHRSAPPGGGRAPRSAAFGERSEAVGEKPNGLGNSRRGSSPLGSLLPCAPVSRPGCACV